jgi:PST family polysaccharide transporter
MNKKIIENAISLSLLQAVTLFLPLITIPYIAIVLGPSLVGDISFSIAAIQIIMTISDYGFNLTGPREIAVHRDSKEKVFDIWLSVTILKILLSFLGALILLLACIFSKKINNNIELIFISFLLVIGNIVYPQWLFQG